jgi:hypothetical protein
MAHPGTNRRPAEVQAVVVDALVRKHTVATHSVAAVGTAIQTLAGGEDALILHTRVPALVAGSAIPPASVVPADLPFAPGSAAGIPITDLPFETGTILGAQLAALVGLACGVTAPGDVMAKTLHARMVLRADAADASTAVGAALQSFAGSEPAFTSHTVLATSARAVPGTHTAVFTRIAVGISAPGDVNAHRSALWIRLGIPAHLPFHRTTGWEHPFTGVVRRTDPAVSPAAVVSALTALAGCVQTNPRAADMAARTGAVVWTGQAVFSGVTGSVATPRNVHAQALGALEMNGARPALAPAAVLATLQGFAGNERALPVTTVLSAVRAGAAIAPAAVLTTLRPQTGRKRAQTVHTLLATGSARTIQRTVAAVLFRFDIAGSIPAPGLVGTLAVGALVMLWTPPAGSRAAVPAALDPFAIGLASVETLVPLLLAFAHSGDLETVVGRALRAVGVDAVLQTLPDRDRIGSCTHKAVVGAGLVLAALHTVHDLPAEFRPRPDTLPRLGAGLPRRAIAAGLATNADSALPAVTGGPAVLRALASILIGIAQAVSAIRVEGVFQIQQVQYVYDFRQLTVVCLVGGDVPGRSSLSRQVRQGICPRTVRQMARVLYIAGLAHRGRRTTACESTAQHECHTQKYPIQNPSCQLATDHHDAPSN